MSEAAGHPCSMIVGVFVRDSGLLHALLDLETLDAVLGHPAAGPSYESFVVENLVAAAGPAFHPYHYRTARGDEADLVLVRGGVPVAAFEVKRSMSPSPARGAGGRSPISVSARPTSSIPMTGKRRTNRRGSL